MEAKPMETAKAHRCPVRPQATIAQSTAASVVVPKSQRMENCGISMLLIVADWPSFARGGRRGETLAKRYWESVWRIAAT